MHEKIGNQFIGKKVLITGGLGFIGSNLAIRCLSLGADIEIFDNLDINSGGNLSNILGFESHIKLSMCDLMNYPAIIDSVRGKDFIFNCAASTSHLLSMREPRHNLDSNVGGVINLLEAIRLHNSGAVFIQLGTTTQLGVLKDTPATEAHAEFPLDIYSANKSLAEKYTLIYSNTYSLNNSVVRLPNIFGPKAAIHSPEFTFNNYFMGLALKGENIKVFGGGAQLRNVLYVDDAVDAIMLAAINENSIGEVFTAAHDEHWSVLEIAEMTMARMGRGHVECIEWPNTNKLIDVGSVVLSGKKIKDCLGWTPKIKIDEGLIKSKNFYDKHLSLYLK